MIENLRIADFEGFQRGLASKRFADALGRLAQGTGNRGESGRRASPQPSGRGRGAEEGGKRNWWNFRGVEKLRSWRDSRKFKIKRFVASIL